MLLLNQVARFGFQFQELEFQPQLWPGLVIKSLRQMAFS